MSRIIKLAIFLIASTVLLSTITKARFTQFSVNAPVGWAALDGRSGASSGCSAQQPTALSAENVRPPWQVSGIDYAVGAPCDISFKDPATFTWGGAGVCDVGSGTELRCDNVPSGLIIEGYDFGTGGAGWTVHLVNDQNVIIRNNKFSGTARAGIYADTNSQNITIEHNTFDQSNVPDTETTVLTLFGGSTHTVRWNWFFKANQHIVESNSGVGTTISLVWKYNFIDQLTPKSTLDHPNWTQFCVNIGAGTTISFNGYYQGSTLAGIAGIQVADGCGGGITMTTPDVSYNTVYTFTPVGVSAIFYRDGGGANTTINGTFTNNYFDDTGTLGGVGGGGSIGGGWFHGDNSGWTTCTGNFNMQDGSAHGC